MSREGAGVGTEGKEEGARASEPSSPKRPKLMSEEELLHRRKEYIAPSFSLHYSKYKPLHIVSGKLQYLYDENDEPYLDCINNVTHVGHCHPRVVEAGSKQMATLGISFPNDQLFEKYSKRLLSTFPAQLDCVLYTCSGSEANDLALRLAEAFTGNTDVITIEGAYHGHTLPLMGLSTYKLKQAKEGVSSLSTNPHAWVTPLPDSYRGEFRDPETAGASYAQEVKKVIQNVESKGKKVASFLCESFPGCAGQVQLPKGYLKAVYELVRAAGGLCIADEVQTGFGRAGDYFWIFESQGVCPDIVTVGKPIANGHPVSAVITTTAIAKKFLEAEGPHAQEKYTSDPVSLSMADAVLTVIEEEQLQEKAKKNGDYVMSRLREMGEKHPCIGDVRGYGLFIGFELVKDRESREPDKELAQDLIKKALLEHRILIMNDGLDHNVIKIKPPMCFTRGNADDVLKAIEKCLEELGR